MAPVRCYHPYSRDVVIGGASQLVAGGQPGGLQCGHVRGVTCARHAKHRTISNSGCWAEDLVHSCCPARHALLRKLLYAPKGLPELLGVASAACCRRDGTALLIGASASGVLLSSLGTSPARPRRRAMMWCVSLSAGQACFATPLLVKGDGAVPACDRHFQLFACDVCTIKCVNGIALHVHPPVQQQGHISLHPCTTVTPHAGVTTAHPAPRRTRRWWAVLRPRTQHRGQTGHPRPAQTQD